MNDTERFPKPDVPWFHEMYDNGSWDKYRPDDRNATVFDIRHDAGWEARLVDRQFYPGTICGLPVPDRFRGECGLSPGHDGLHFGVSVDRPARVVSLRRVAQPAQVTS